MTTIHDEIVDYLKESGKWRSAVEIADGIASKRRERAQKAGKWMGKISYRSPWWYLFLAPWSGNLYPALYELELHGKIDARWRDETSLSLALRGGLRQRQYHYVE